MRDLQKDLSHVNKVIKSATTFLQRWSGLPGQMWELTSSHKTLRIVITRSTEQQNLMLSCIDPRSIKGPIVWSSSQLQVSQVNLGMNDIGYLVQDLGTGLEVYCGELEVRENIKLG